MCALMRNSSEVVSIAGFPQLFRVVSLFFKLVCRFLIGCIALFLLSACQPANFNSHKYFMQGQIISVEDNKIVLCIGERHGAKVGQQLDVFMHVREKNKPSHKAPEFKYRREMIGKVRIDSIIDEHYATASIISGKADVNNTVEIDE